LPIVVFVGVFGGFCILSQESILLSDAIKLLLLIFQLFRFLLVVNRSTPDLGGYQWSAKQQRWQL